MHVKTECKTDAMHKNQSAYLFTFGLHWIGCTHLQLVRSAFSPLLSPSSNFAAQCRQICLRWFCTWRPAANRTAMRCTQAWNPQLHEASWTHNIHKIQAILFMSHTTLHYFKPFWSAHTDNHCCATKLQCKHHLLSPTIVSSNQAVQARATGNDWVTFLKIQAAVPK